VFAACDFVGSEKSLAFAAGALAKGGKIAVTGLLGGNFPLPATMFVLKAMTVEGTLTGTLAEAREVVALAQAGKIAPLPIEERPLSAAQASLDDLRAGRVVGRVVLVA
jgi:alcohol dehydrogenase